MASTPCITNAGSKILGLIDLNYTLYDYQQECIDKIMHARKMNTSRQIVSLPMGTGKTIILGTMAEAEAGKTLILAHTTELVQQAVEKIKLLNANVSIGICKANLNEIDKDIVVASIQTASRGERLQQLLNYDFSLLIIDEAHHSCAKTYVNVIKNLGFMDKNPDKLLLGFTATPIRADGIALGNVFQDIVYEKTIPDMIMAGRLADLYGINISTNIDISGFDNKDKDYDIKQLSSVINTDKRNELIVEGYIKNADDKKAIAFCCDINHVKALTAEFNRRNIKAEGVWGETSLSERGRIIESFKNGDITVIVNCNVLTEGFDCPDIEAVLMCRPTKSKTLYTQCVGRGTRLAPGKKQCIVIDYTDKANEICTLGTLVGRKGKPLNNVSIKEMVTAMNAKAPLELECSDGSIVQKQIDFLVSRRYKWIDIGNGHMGFPISHKEYLYIIPMPQKMFAVYKINENGKPVKIIECDLLQRAIKIAEDEIARRCPQLASTNASWRSNPASHSQLQIMRRKGMQFDKNISSGLASELISEYFCKANSWKVQPATNNQLYKLSRIGVNYKGYITKGEASELIKEDEQFQESVRRLIG